MEREEKHARLLGFLESWIKRATYNGTIWLAIGFSPASSSTQAHLRSHTAELHCVVLPTEICRKARSRSRSRSQRPREAIRDLGWITVKSGTNHSYVWRIQVPRNQCRFFIPRPDNGLLFFCNLDSSPTTLPNDTKVLPRYILTHSLSLSCSAMLCKESHPPS